MCVFGRLHTGQQALHIHTSWPAYTAMFGSSSRVLFSHTKSPYAHSCVFGGGGGGSLLVRLATQIHPPLGRTTSMGCHIPPLVATCLARHWPLLPQSRPALAYPSGRPRACAHSEAGRRGCTHLRTGEDPRRWDPGFKGRIISPQPHPRPEPLPFQKALLVTCTFLHRRREYQHRANTAQGLEQNVAQWSALTDLQNAVPWRPCPSLLHRTPVATRSTDRASREYLTATQLAAAHPLVDVPRRPPLCKQRKRSKKLRKQHLALLRQEP